MTPRLVLVRMRTDDWPHLRSIDADPEAMATLGGLRSEEESLAYAAAQAWHWEEHRFGWWMVFDRRSRAFVGRGGLRHLDIEGVGEVEVGYALARSWWGRGLATELARAAVHVGACTLGLPRLVGITLTTNHASRRVLEKAGLTHERDIVHASLPHALYAWSVGDPLSPPEVHVHIHDRRREDT